MRRSLARRGSSLYHVLITLLILATLLAAGRLSQVELQRATASNPDRARARALAEAAWTRARATLSAGGDPTQPLDEQLGGRAQVQARQSSRGRWHVEIEASVSSHFGGGSEPSWTTSRLVLELEVRAKRVRVRSRREGGA